jgi:hypothetical protein
MRKMSETRDLMCSVKGESKDGLLLLDSSYSVKEASIDLGLSSSKDHVD